MADPGQEFLAALRVIGKRAASAAIATTLKSLGEVGSHLTDALQRSAKAAEKMAAGEPYKNPFEEGDDDDIPPPR